MWVDKYLDIRKKRAIVIFALIVFGLSAMPAIGDWVTGILAKDIFGPITVKLMMGVLALFGGWLFIKKAM